MTSTKVNPSQKDVVQLAFKSCITICTLQQMKVIEGD